jgi:hypothetical protein
MNKELFIKAINELQKQIQNDIEFSENLGKAFPDAFPANLMPRNILPNILLEILQHEMNDLTLCEYGQSWIEYFCYELDFGKENWRLKVTDKGKEIPMSTAEELYDFLKHNSLETNL